MVNVNLYNHHLIESKKVRILTDKLNKLYKIRLVSKLGQVSHKAVFDLLDFKLVPTRHTYPQPPTLQGEHSHT